VGFDDLAARIQAARSQHSGSSFDSEDLREALVELTSLEIRFGRERKKFQDRIEQALSLTRADECLWTLDSIEQDAIKIEMPQFKALVAIRSRALDQAVADLKSKKMFP
jgi:hypothetical protein